MSDIRAFLDYTKAELIEISFDVNPALENFEEAPSLSAAPFEVEIVRGLSFSEEDDVLHCSCKIEVSFDVYAAGSSNESSGRGFSEKDDCLAARGRCSMSGGAFCDLDSEDAEGLQRKVLAANTISYLWGKIRDWVELISLSSITGRVQLPAVDPFALVGELSESNEDE